MSALPAYLADPGEPERTYGTLSLDVDRNLWVIEGEPQAVIMAKKLFPGSQGRGRGVAKFPNNRRILGDLNWLMMRYPLRVTTPDIWDAAIAGARDHVLELDQINRAMPAANDPAGFNGSLRDHQREAHTFLMLNKRTLLGDNMALGKTVSAMGLAADVNKWPVLCVVEPHMTAHWIKHANRFLGTETVTGKGGELFTPSGPGVHEIQGQKPYALPNCSVFVIHYLLLRHWCEVLSQYDFGAVFFDEIQHLRHSKSQKYSAAATITETTEYVIGLSGTPIYGRGGEIWNIMNIIERHCLGDWDSFTREWCTGYGSDIVRDPKLLSGHLREQGLMLRRSKEDTGETYAKYHRIPQDVVGDEGVYTQLMAKAYEKLDEAQDAQTPWDRGRLEEAAVEAGRRAAGIAKAANVSAFVASLLDADERVLLFAHHHDVIDIYLDKLKGHRPVVISGRQTPAQKQQAEQDFKDGKTNLCIVSIRVATGLDGLSDATCAVFGELDWSPAVHRQCEERAGRKPKSEETAENWRDWIPCYYMVWEGSTDDDVQDSLGLKIAQFVGIMGDTPESEADKALAAQRTSEHMKSALSRIKSARRRPALPIAA